MIEKVEQIASRNKGYEPKQQGPDLTPEERTEQVWGLFQEYSTFRRNLYRQGLRTQMGERKFSALSAEEKADIRVGINKNPLVQTLEGEITHLWQDPSVRNTFTVKVKEASRQLDTNAKVIRRYRSLRRQSSRLEDQYFDLLRRKFLATQDTPTLTAIEISRNKVAKQQTDYDLQHLEVAGGMPHKLQEKYGGLDREHADIAALIAFERILGYHQQFKKDGIIITPSREQLMEKVVEKTSSGTWMQLVGETGTGKTTLAKKASWILNGKPAQYASGEKWGDVKSLIGSKTIEGGNAYFEFGPLVVALTGCQNSLEMEAVIRTSKDREGNDVSGELLILDELNKFNQDALFGVLKIPATLRPGERFNFKELPGVDLQMATKGTAIISTMNPATVRYERNELDPALEKLFYDGKEYVDYPAMTAMSPELYEIFLAVLMDDSGRIRVAQEELAPAFKEVTDTASGIIKSEIETDIKKHGALYRFALAAAEIHRSFTQKDNVAKTATDTGFLDRTVLEMDVLIKWIRGYSSEIEGGESLTTYLDKKLVDFQSKIESASDKAIFERISRHFGFSTGQARRAPKPQYTPLTPIEMGYLTPRTSREVRKVGEEVVPRTKLYLHPTTGEEITYLPVDLQIEPTRILKSGEKLNFLGEEYLYLGKDMSSENPDKQYDLFIPVKG